MSDFEHARGKDLTCHPKLGVTALDKSGFVARFPVLGYDPERGILSAAPPPVNPKPTDAQVAAFGDAFYGDLTQWGYSERQRNGLAEDVRLALRAAFAVGMSGNPADDSRARQP